MAATRPHRTNAESSAGERAAMAATWTLHIQAGDDAATRVLELGATPIRVGRGIQCEVRLNQVGLGDVQCMIRRRNDQWHFQPIGPPGRIWIDGRPADNQRELPVGVELRVGLAVLTIRGSDPDGRRRGSFDAPITINAETIASTPTPELPHEPEPVIEPEVDSAPTAEGPGDDRARRWQSRLEQRDQWLKDRQNEKRWEARWKAAGETLRARSTPISTPPPPTAPAHAAPEPAPAPPVGRPLPDRSPVVRSFEPRPVFGHTRRIAEPDPKFEPRRVPVHTQPAEPVAPPVEARVPAATPPQPDPTPAPIAAPEPPVTVAAPPPAIMPTPAVADPLAVDFADVEAALAELTPAPTIAEPPAPVVVEAPAAPIPDEPTAITPPPITVVARPVEVAPEPAAPPAEAPKPRRVRSPLKIKLAPEPAPQAEAKAKAETAPPEYPGGMKQIAHTDDDARGPSKPAPAAAVEEETSSRRAGPAAAPQLNPKPAEPTGSQAKSTAPTPGSKEYPSARSIFAAQGSRPTGAGATTATAGSKRPRRTPEPTEAVRPDGWTIPFALGWLPSVALVLALGGFAVGLAVVWLEDASSGNIAIRLATRPSGTNSPAIDAQAIPKSAWWQTTASHLAAWALALDRVGNGEDRSADARILEADARSVSPLGARARFVAEPVPGQEADASASIRLGPTRDIVTLTAMAHRLRRENKRADAIRAYRTAFLTAATTARGTLNRPTFRADPQVNRYALPHSALLDGIARDMASAGEWTPEEWAEATPDFGPALLAVATALREKNPPEAELRLEAICRGAEKPLAPHFEAAEHQASIAEALAERGRWTDAVAQYRRAIEEESRDLDRRVWWFNLAEVARRSGDDPLRSQAIEAAKGADLSDEVTRRAAAVHRNAPDANLSARNR